MKQYTVAILGATGAVGTQMLECLNEQEFPVGKLKLLASARSAGKTVEFRGEQVVIEEACPEAFEGCDIVLGAAGDDIAKELLPEAVYGLPELYAAETAKARLVANPGCYPSSAILGLYAAFKHGLISPDNIVIDSKSGTSGAGRKPVVPSLFCEVYDTFRAYGLGKHRHTPEIEQEYSRAAGCDVRVSFNPHLVPMVRGILSTIYTTLRKPGTTLDEVHAAYCETWAQSPWVRVLPKGKLPETRFVRGSMFCDLGLVVDPRTNRLIVVSAIDNLCRGASGQALANANLMCGLPVDCGLNAAPMLP